MGSEPNKSKLTEKHLRDQALGRMYKQEPFDPHNGDIEINISKGLTDKHKSILEECGATFENEEIDGKMCSIPSGVVDVPKYRKLIDELPKEEHYNE